MVNSTSCPVLEAPTDPVPFYSNGNINFKAHDVGWIVCGFFTLIASTCSFWLVWKHLTYYTCPQQQRHIVRMLFMVPIYAIVSTLSYVFFREGLYYQTIRDCYEAVVITSFFNLLLQYVGDTPAEQQEVFRQVKLEKWVIPLNFWKYRPDGLHFLWLMKICILQYAIVRPVCTLAAVGLQYFGIYCLQSWDPVYGHIWITVCISISVSVAMFCIIQFYMPIKEELKPYAPILKFLAVKSVVFLTFWQDSFLSLLVDFGAIKPSKYMTAADIQTGLNALLETFEMVIFGFLHIKAFTYLVYRPQDREKTTRRGRALLDVLDFRDWWYDMKSTTRYVAARSRGKNFTVVDDIRREKYQHLERALGRDRWAHLQIERQRGKKSRPTFWKDEKEVEDTDLLMSTSDLEKSLETVPQDKEQERKPRGNQAMRADYDPEGEERELEGKPWIEKSTNKSSTDSLAKPTVPFLPYDLYARNSLRDIHPELTQYHQAAGVDDDDNIIEAQEEDDMIFVPRKGGRARKEASLGLGAWWRTFRERVSGNGAEESGNGGEAHDEEKRGMLADEIGRGIAIMAAEENTSNEEEEELMPPLARRGANDSSNSLDASASALRSRDSPLSLIINEHRKEEEREGERNRNLAKIVPSSQIKQVAIIKDRESMARHGSTKVALDDEEDLTSQSQQTSSSSNRKRIGKVEMMSREMNRINEAPQISSVVPSISGSHSYSAAAGPPSNSTSTAELQRQRVQSRQTLGGMKGTGPKGKSIPIVLPAALSPYELPPVMPLLPPVVVPPPALNGNNSTSSTSIRFAEIKPVPHRRDDPEAEPVQLAGTVIVGAQSLSQVNALKKNREAEQLRKQEEEKLRHRQNEQRRRAQDEQIRWRESSERQRRAQENHNRQREMRSRKMQQGQERSGEGGRRTQQQKLNQNHSNQSRRNRSSPPEPYIALPAPSQLAKMDNRQDPFSAAVLGMSGSSVMQSMAQQQRRRSIEVGSIVTHQEVMNITTPHYGSVHHQHPPPLSHQQRSHRGPPPRHYSNPPPPLPTAPPRQNQGSVNPQQQRPARHSIGSTSRPSAVVASYDRYSGEPAWLDNRQASSRVESRRRQYEAPQGFQFDYID